LIVADITIHVDPAKGALERIDQSIMVLVQFLKVIVQDLIGLGIWRPTSSALSARVIPLRLFEYSMVREVRLWLYDDWGRPFYHRPLMEADLPVDSLGWFLTLCHHLRQHLG
jgi:hypothetical protein